MTTVRWRRRNSVCKQRGFSLPEALFALLLLATSVSALLHYHLALAQGFSQQWQQRVAVRVAAQRLMGHEMPGWRTSLERSNALNCTLERAEVSGAHQGHAILTRLRC
ncbi:prepilin-type N-terminal cleavage/methylation domain-containing protein [Pantoea sp. ACRSB]|uniref:prepilin-type N-terminal cleavage/methylation domain-containing protein n=1 Tax=Pantoea sp. ACRSB TaxID=2918207 RepID=UPI002892F1C2|nr:prepilin-type N-terminal cleavage/methylation domain-containing protein [Pantoea sp. ACRSB]MCG7388064.1 prepilin-type cleavage/methylation domain-containing protein [Pantoea sp. ACRSB]